MSAFNELHPVVQNHIKSCGTAIGIGLVIGAFVLGIAWAIQGNAEREHEERIACNEAGGTYIMSGLEDELCLVGLEER